jgi:glycosyltransferase involved in cell wall biosynthesis
MYLIPIHVPFYVDGANLYLATDWMRSLRLLRDSFNGQLGTITVVAPMRQSDANDSSQMLEKLDANSEGIDVRASFDNNCRSRDYWMHHRGSWRRLLRELVSKATVVHTALDDLYRPIAYEGFREAMRQRRATVFVQDTDIVLQTRQLNRGANYRRRLQANAYSSIYERLCRNAVQSADLALLKGSALMRRYAGVLGNAKEFHDTSIKRSDVIESSVLESRCVELKHRLEQKKPLRLVYCGRLTRRKGVHESIAIVSLANRLGTPVELDVFGSGEQVTDLEALIGSLGAQSYIRLLGPMAYGPGLLQKLASYDGLMFTPLAEDTPRMIFDGYASGLPLIGYDIDYVTERSHEESAAWLLPSRQVEASAHRLIQLASQPATLVELSFAARAAAEYHSVENWYERRATWTMEAVDRHRFKGDASVAWKKNDGSPLSTPCNPKSTQLVVSN